MNEPIDRRLWAAMLAKLTAPMDAERAAKAISGIMPLLGSFPDQAFTVESVKEVAATGRVLSEGVYGPLTRVPTFGELETTLGRWWYRQRQREAIAAEPVARERLPAPPPPTDEARQQAIAEVSDLIRSFERDRSWNQKQAEDVIKASGHKSVPVSDGVLLKIWEKELANGTGGADIRVNALRKKLNIRPGRDDRAGWQDAAE